MERREFAATASLFFIALGVVRLPAQVAYGIMTPDRLAYGALALIPVLGLTQASAWIGACLCPSVFDRLELALLTILAVRVVFAGLV